MPLGRASLLRGSWALPGDLHVVNVALTDTGAGDLDELSLVAHVVNGAATAVTHRSLQATGHLVQDGEHRALCKEHGLRCLPAPACLRWGWWFRRFPGSSGRPNQPSSHRSNPCRGSSYSYGLGTRSLRQALLPVPANMPPIITALAPAAMVWQCRPNSECRRQRSTARPCLAARWPHCRWR